MCEGELKLAVRAYKLARPLLLFCTRIHAHPHTCARLEEEKDSVVRTTLLNPQSKQQRDSFKCHFSSESCASGLTSIAVFVLNDLVVLLCAIFEGKLCWMFFTRRCP